MRYPSAAYHSPFLSESIYFSSVRRSLHYRRMLPTWRKVCHGSNFISVELPSGRVADYKSVFPRLEFTNCPALLLRKPHHEIFDIDIESELVWCSLCRGRGGVRIPAVKLRLLLRVADAAHDQQLAVRLFSDCGGQLRILAQAFAMTPVFLYSRARLSSPGGYFELRALGLRRHITQSPRRAPTLTSREKSATGRFRVEPGIPPRRVKSGGRKPPPQ